ncbi:pumilio-family RNA binding repeat protein [Phlyctema vagabunda]|uniref:Pumilio-family RNA binding repeat protein n=1 Tax=Phlyctema vagabunda TaxID=108571 RepID=A0ABR4PDA4_9HELO
MSDPSNGSPTFRRSVVNRSFSQENAAPAEDKATARQDFAGGLKKSATALASSKLGNQAPKKVKTNHDLSSSSELNPMDLLLAKLSEQQAVLQQQQDALKEDNIAYNRTVEFVSTTSSSVPITPATDTFDSTAPTTGPGSAAGDMSPLQDGDDEVLRLKLELEAAKGKIALMDQELAQNRITKHTIDQAIGTPSEADFPLNQHVGVTDQRLNNLQHSLSGGRPQIIRDGSWAAAQDDTRSDTSDALSAGGFNRARAIWNNQGKQPFGDATGLGSFPASQGVPSGQWMGRDFNQSFAEPMMSYGGPGMNSYRNDRMMESDMMMPPPGNRRNNVGGRFHNRAAFPYSSSNSSFDGYTPSVTPYGSVSGMSGGVAPMGPSSSIGLNVSGGLGNMYASYHPSPIGTPLSPHAPEFTSAGVGVPWKAESIASEGQTFLPTTEPLNYRRLLDRSVNCNWKYIVDKIVCNNDQQASIFLQQKLKVGTTEQKYDIVEAIVAQAYPLMVNRFGNFLVQRCFEHGTPEQVIKIAEAIRSNTLNLSMDAFGCHVVQKAFDSVPEDYKAIMVHELLRRIPETVIHRYACHVWQKLFELRWTESPPQIMKYVNEALRGMWHEVALGETGSLVVQNIFENCLEEDKRPCIEEVLASIDIVAHGQFGNWCIQHICEHGAPADRSRAIDHVIRYASEYSMDQFASKVVEKCLKIGGVDFLGRYLDRVCEGRLDRPRIPLIDIASDQYGNYLIQYILTNSNPQHREIVASHIRKHMVSLRGSKFGSRVGMLCTNPAITTRPGPGVGPSNIGAVNPRINGPPQNARYGGGYR